ncbi:type II toxin-antitoxin system death-on-curing family toxin [Leptolyngbya sp. FACHB-17]|uniref:type II toxin-antitoxin system death-on-curing family toxin n=1 Tax=unclassified Leptolyngbya TaxID=2650499 RepID=UPI001680ECA0|nr:type II toxin-antitoxin system death-on-curing family toxin [Leptolyngbya sp. FACHB-17]MBD2079742.1 type II toxin-antitoxin system death-on-curing family toxin [Leptolyngbya sp. FACHB-17]
MPEFLTLEEVIQTHEAILEQFGGASGVRDQGLLQSALAQPQATFAGELLHLTLFDQAAAYLFHLAMNHPFLDGNKRTAFAAADIFLRLNGFRLNLSQDEKFEFVIRVVSGGLDKEAAAYLEQVSVPRS